MYYYLTLYIIDKYIVNLKDNYKVDLTSTRGIELALLLIALFGFWEFTLSSWPFQSREFNDLWPALRNNEQLLGTLVSVNEFASNNSRILEVIPTLIAEACFVSYALGRRRLFAIFGSIALLLFGATLHLTNFTHGNHPYYDFLMLTVMVLAPGSLTSLRVAYALTYFMCSLLKINAGWITGSFFLTAHGYLPFTPPEAVPYLTKLMIIFQMFGCFLLLCKNLRTRQLIATLFLFFHLYSVIIAGSRFSWSTFPFIVLLYMSVQEGDRHITYLSGLPAFLKNAWIEAKHSCSQIERRASAVVAIFMVLQILAYYDLISEKRTFNMFSEATSCVVTIAGPSFYRQYGHPVGSNACFKDQVILNAKNEFCATSGDFDLRLEISKNASNYRVEHEQLSVCFNQVQANNLPSAGAEKSFSIQDFISPLRSGEKVEVSLSTENSYVFHPQNTSALRAEYWQVGKIGQSHSDNLPNVDSILNKIVQWALLTLWLAMSATVLICLAKKTRA